MQEPIAQSEESFLKRLRSNIQAKFRPSSQARIQRRRNMTATLTARAPLLKLLLFLAGYAWMVAIPIPQLGRGTYIDENALQPSQVNTYWSWGDVHTADRYLAQLETLRDVNSTSVQLANFFKAEFNQLGLSASTQSYNFSTGTTEINGTNAYSVLASPRGPGTEAMVISASWLSRTGDGTLNLRGVATVLALAGFLRHYSLWAKDIIFVISDGYLDGMHAWLSAYHGVEQRNLHMDGLELSSGVIWTALNIDYPGHSFSHLGIFHEGLNGRLPNQDLLNSFQRISRYTGGVPVSIYDHLDPQEDPTQKIILPTWISTAIHRFPEIGSYIFQTKNVAQHVLYQALGRGSGVHGLFHQFRIDAITIFAIPASGPHGFHALGRIIESTLRTMNNLLERLHASFFFYVLTSPDRFAKIGSYLPSAVLISIAMMFHGLSVWVNSGWMQIIPERMDYMDDKSILRPEWIRRKRSVLTVILIMICTHLAGCVLFFYITKKIVVNNHWILSLVIFGLLSLLALIAISVPSGRKETASLSEVLKALNLCFASTVISITTVLNFSLAATLAVSLGIPLAISSPSKRLPIRVANFVCYCLLALGWLFLHEEVVKAVWNWEILSVWFAPFVCIVYVPLVLQAGIVCLLPP